VSRDSSVGIATGYVLDGRGSIPGRVKRYFYSLQCSDRTELLVYFKGMIQIIFYIYICYMVQFYIDPSGRQFIFNYFL
jgi:hypothetical protein